MNRSAHDYVNRIIYKTMGIASFVRRIEWRKILQWLQPQEGENVLDVACGVGWLTLKIAESGCEAYGVDMSEEAIESAARNCAGNRASCQFAIGNAEQLPYADGHFDRVVCSSSLEHIRDDVKALKEMGRVLKPEGNLVLTVDSLTYPISQELKDRHAKMCFVVRYYTQERLVRTLDASGLRLLRTEYLLNSWLTHLFFDLWIRYRRYNLVWIVIALVGYPVFLVSDRLFGIKHGGYTLIVEARRAEPTPAFSS